MTFRNTRRRQSLSGFSGVLLAVCALTTSMPDANAAYSHYRNKAQETSAFIQKTFYDEKEGLYHGSQPRGRNSLPYEFMWGNGVQFTNLVSATKYDPKTYRPILYAFAKGLRHYWDKDAPVPGFDAYWSSPNGDDKYYDDNQWLVLGFVEAYELTKDTFFLDWARETQEFSLSGWDDKLGGGIYWFQDHKSKNTCSNAPGAAAAMRLYQVGRTKEDKAQLEWALRIRHWLNATLKDEDGLYWDNINLDGRIEKTKWTYNTALMIRTDVLLYKSTNVKQYLTEARRMADAGIKEWVDPATGAIRNPPRFTHLFCESLLRLFDATRDPKYLNTVRRYADYLYAHARDPKGGFCENWTTWPQKEHSDEDRKLLIENAAISRLFYLLAPYPDVEELIASADARIAERQFDRAEPLLRQAVESAPGSVEARYRFWQVLTRRKKNEEAARETARLAEMAQEPAVRARLEALGWKQPAAR